MPLIDANSPPTSTDTHYVVYFASGEPSWCPDCRDALPALNAVFGGASDPTAYIVRGTEVGRLGDKESQIESSLRKLVNQ
ncbi:Uncharacterized protein Y057_10700 [Fusarium fujikuroi]|nr:Uncharacterized protein Y057_10700 [Fusarium fujikuroi]